MAFWQLSTFSNRIEAFMNLAFGIVFFFNLIDMISPNLEKVYLILSSDASLGIYLT